MSPIGKLVGRVHRPLVLLVMTCHGHTSAVVVQRVHRHSLINIVIRDFQLACEFDIVVGELSNLHIIDTKSLLFFGRAQTEYGQELANEVESAEDQTSADEGVRTTRNRVGKLVAQLDPVVVQPATWDDSVSI